MAEIIAPTKRQRLIAELRAHGATDDEILARLNPQGETIIVQQAPPARNNVPWYVGGSLAALAMLISFAWSALERFWALFDQYHELAMAAAKPAPAVVNEAVQSGDIWMVPVMIVVAVVLIAFGLARRGG